MNPFKKKKAPEPTTVSEAVAPFKTVRDNLNLVVAKSAARKAEATRRVTDAKAYAAQVEADETAAAEAANAELAQAEKISKALAQLVGDDA